MIQSVFPVRKIKTDSLEKYTVQLKKTKKELITWAVGSFSSYTHLVIIVNPTLPVHQKCSSNYYFIYMNSSFRIWGSFQKTYVFAQVFNEVLALAEIGRDRSSLMWTVSWFIILPEKLKSLCERNHANTKIIAKEEGSNITQVFFPQFLVLIAGWFWGEWWGLVG